MTIESVFFIALLATIFFPFLSLLAAAYLAIEGAHVLAFIALIWFIMWS